MEREGIVSERGKVGREDEQQDNIISNSISLINCSIAKVCLAINIYLLSFELGLAYVISSNE